MYPDTEALDESCVFDALAVWALEPLSVGIVKTCNGRLN